MRIKAGYVPTQLRALRSSVKNQNFSKDAEIAQRVIEFATDNLNVAQAPGITENGNYSPATNFNLPDLSNTAARVKNRSETNFDGYFVGYEAQTFAPSTSLSEIPAVIPRGKAKNNKTLVYINGICTTRKRLAESLKSIADAAGSRAIGIYNATQGGLLDRAQSARDKFHLGNNQAINTLSDVLYNELCAAREVNLLAHSHGAIITSRALQDVFNRLRLEDNLSREAAENMLVLVKVETFGGAAHYYPDGPRYTHYINCKDLIPQLFGLRKFLHPFVNPGRDAITHYFNAGGGFRAHALEGIYLNERIRIEQRR